MKRALLLLLLISCLASGITAQRLVNPNRPSNLPSTGSSLVAIAELQSGIGSGDASIPYSKGFIGFNAIIGYQASRNFIFGLGSGVSFYNGGILVPFFLDIRYTFNAQFIEPYLFADGGLMLDFSYLDESRIFMNPGIGIRYSIKPKIDVYAAAGAFLQSGNTNQDVFINLKAGVAYRF
jgi:hypothetical protein